MDSGQSKKTPRGRAAGAHATTQPRTEALRAMPSIDECLRAFAGDAECDRLGHAYVRLMLRRAQAEVRSGLIAQAAHSPAPARARLVDEIVRRARAAIAAD